MGMRLERSAAEFVLPVLHDLGAAVEVSSYSPLRVKAVDRIAFELIDHGPAGQPLAPALHLASGGPVGNAYRSDENEVIVRTGLVNIRCTNFHTAGIQGHDLSVADPKTRIAEIVAAAFDRARFATMIERMGMSGWNEPLKGDPVAMVASLAYRFRLVEAECQSILRHLQREPQSTWGLASAFTRTAQDMVDHRRREHLENVGGMIPREPTMWRALEQRTVEFRRPELNHADAIRHYRDQMADVRQAIGTPEYQWMDYAR